MEKDIFSHRPETPTETPVKDPEDPSQKWPFPGNIDIANLGAEPGVEIGGDSALPDIDQD